MIEDIRAIMWKEWKGLFRQRGSRGKLVLTFLVPVGMFAIWMPLQARANWLASGGSAFAAVILPMLFAMLAVPDSFAGERERHTLATLLASRLSDGAILAGKALFSILLGWIMAIAALVIGCVVANLAIVQEGGSPMFYRASVLVADLGFGLLCGSLATGAGIVLSLRAATVQEAQQTLAAVLFLPPTVLGPVMFLIADRGSGRSVARVFAALGTPTGLVSMATFLLALTLLLFWAARRRFRRGHLVTA